MQIDPGKAQFTSAQREAIVISFADRLDALLNNLVEDDRREFMQPITDVSRKLRQLASDLGEGDPDVAFEIITTCARLIGMLRLVAGRRPMRTSLH